MRGASPVARSSCFCISTWLLYLTCSAVAFETSSIGLYQVLMQKHDDRATGDAPRTREDLYGRRA